MRFLFLALACAGCAVTPLTTANTRGALDVRELEGTWHVGASTFPMWLDGSRRTPTFTYSRIVTREGRVSMDDRVAYVTASGESATIDGVDVQHATVPTHFTWSGRGFLAAFTSEWDVVSIDAQGRYAIITFGATLATPAGLDVISRAPLTDEAFALAQAEIENTPELKAISAGLQRLKDR
ncbi:MAG: hypothetical protein QM817_02275 [Archangium sp.]